MAGFETVLRSRLKDFTPAAVKEMHIRLAREGLAAYMRSQREKPGYTIHVDGSPASSERGVKPFGVIEYRFIRLREIARAALAEAIRQSPRRSGRYRRSWFAMVDGAEVDTRAIPPGTREILITNDQPYSRKINVGAKGFKAYAPPGVVERVKEIMKRRFGNIAEFRTTFVTLDGGYVLQRDQYRRDRQGRRSARPRRDALKGSALNYPTLKIVMR